MLIGDHFRAVRLINPIFPLILLSNINTKSYQGAVESATKNLSIAEEKIERVRAKVKQGSDTQESVCILGGKK